MKLKNILSVFLFVLGFLPAAMAYQVPVSDSLFAEEKPDTLVDLNRVLGGLKELVVSKETLIPEAVTITPEGRIILNTPSALKAESYAFEVKATASDEEVYLVSVKISRKGDKILVNTVSDKIDMATGFRKDGKIYVVVAVSLVLFIVLIGYLILLDVRQRKIDKLLQNTETK